MVSLARNRIGCRRHSLAVAVCGIGHNRNRRAVGNAVRRRQRGAVVAAAVSLDGLRHRHIAAGRVLAGDRQHHVGIRRNVRCAARDGALIGDVHRDRARNKVDAALVRRARIIVMVSLARNRIGCRRHSLAVAVGGVGHNRNRRAVRNAVRRRQRGAVIAAAVSLDGLLHRHIAAGRVLAGDRQYHIGIRRNVGCAAGDDAFIGDVNRDLARNQV